MKNLQHLNKYFYKYKWKLLIGLVITIAARIFAIYYIPLIGKSTIIIEKYINGTVTDISTVKSELAYQHYAYHWDYPNFGIFDLFNATNLYCGFQAYGI